MWKQCTCLNFKKRCNKQTKTTLMHRISYSVYITWQNMCWTQMKSIIFGKRSSRWATEWYLNFIIFKLNVKLLEESRYFRIMPVLIKVCFKLAVFYCAQYFLVQQCAISHFQNGYSHENRFHIPQKYITKEVKKLTEDSESESDLSQYICMLLLEKGIFHQPWNTNRFDCCLDLDHYCSKLFFSNPILSIFQNKYSI